MKRTGFIALLILLSAMLRAQSPVQWKAVAEKTADNQYRITVNGTIANGWHSYALTDVETGIDALHIEAAGKNFVGELTADTIRISDPLLDKKKVAVIQRHFTLTQTILFEQSSPAVLEVKLKGFVSNNEEFLPVDETKEISLEGSVAEGSSKLPGVDLNNPAADCGGGQATKDKGLLTIFLLGIGGGLLALLTPCVFPMIPVTVSFFTNRSKTKVQGIKNGLLYGSFIFLIYAIASIPFHLVDLNPQVLNTISTNAWVNVFFFAIFIYFALSFFGLYEIGLPSSFANKAGTKGNLNSVAGIFFMAITLAIVSFSCTGPILGMLLVGSLHGGAWQLSAGMAGFGTALALPFALFAMFPQWLQKLPKSGNWMNTVKKSLAFIELALALKFLSNADLVEHWGLLKREVFIGIWVLIALSLGLYLSGVFTKKRVTGLQNADKLILNKPRPPVAQLIAGIAAIALAAYLVPGVLPAKNSRLNFLSGFPPPVSYSIYKKSSTGIEPDVINDYDKALQLAKKTGKPLLIDFTGWGCVNCRKMEELVWTEPDVKKIIKERYILVSLYVDDRKKLPDGKTIGEKWASFQEMNFAQVTQPLYVVLSPDEKLMNHPVGFTPAASTYQQWLQCGITAFENKKRIAQLKN